jgi:hypothetical protein
MYNKSVTMGVPMIVLKRVINTTFRLSAGLRFLPPDEPLATAEPLSDDERCYLQYDIVEKVCQNRRTPPSLLQSAPVNS